MRTHGCVTGFAASMDAIHRCIAPALHGEPCELGLRVPSCNGHQQHGGHRAFQCLVHGMAWLRTILV